MWRYASPSVTKVPTCNSCIHFSKFHYCRILPKSWRNFSFGYNLQKYLTLYGNAHTHTCLHLERNFHLIINNYRGRKFQTKGVERTTTFFMPRTLWSVNLTELEKIKGTFALSSHNSRTVWERHSSGLLCSE